MTKTRLSVDIAKAELHELLVEVEKGESVAITRNGTPIAVLVPAPYEEDFRAEEKRKKITETIEAIKAFRREHAGGKPTLEEILEESRPR